MRIIEISPLENSAHRNQTGTFSTINDGWAVIPPSMTIPDTFPFVGVEAENGVVTALTPGTVPEPEPEPEPEPTADEVLNALLGVNEG